MSSGRVAVIANAVDDWPAAARASAVRSDAEPLRRLGFTPVELDLREFDSRPSELARALRAAALLWVRGGNTFTLRAALARSGADRLLPDILDDGPVYAGYSAGACVLAPSLRGLELLDDPGPEPIWDGLGLIDRAVVPHWNSPLDTDGATQRLARRYRRAGVAHWTLTDDQVLLVDGARTEKL